MDAGGIGVKPDQYPEDWDRRRRKRLWRDGHECQSCGASDRTLHVHHKTPVSEGGDHSQSNLITLCAECHADAHDADRCKNCGGIAWSGTNVTIVDDSGGVARTLCEDCWSQIRTTTDPDAGRCAGCGDQTSGKYGLYTHHTTGAPPTYPLCNDCWNDFVFADPPAQVIDDGGGDGQ